MMKIWKYTIDRPFSKPIFIKIPRGARLLSLDTQGPESRPPVCLWAEVDENAPEVTMEFHVVQTGDEPPEHFLYVGTFQQDNGSFVGHVYYSPLADTGLMRP